MKIKYFGTAAAEGWPGIFCRCDVCKKATELGGKNLRSRSQALIGDSLLVDFPPDSYYHMLHDGLNLPEIQHIIITHSHQDHFYPLDLNMRGNGFSDEVKGMLHIYGNAHVEKMFNETVSQAGAFCQLDKRLAFHLLENFVPLEIAGYKVTPLTALHDRRENCVIFLIEKDGKTLLYANDTGLFPDETYEFLQGRKLDLVSFDCTMMRVKEGTNHMGLADNVLVKEKLTELGCIHDGTEYVVTHFSHHGGLLHHELEEEAAKLGFIAAYDGLTVEF